MGAMRGRILLVVLAAVLLLTGCSKDLFFTLEPGDCVREKGLGLDWADGIEKISCSEHQPFNPAARTWVVKAVGSVDNVDRNCPQFGIIIVDGDYGVCYYAGQ